MSKIKKKSINALADGIFKFEDRKNIIKTADYSGLNTFVINFLNTPDPKQRKKLAAEFKKRHTELYEFIKENSELIAAETDITRIISAAISGENPAAENGQLTNLFEIIEASLK